MDRLLGLLDSAITWALAQPLIIQIVLGIALLAVVYFLYVVTSITVAALYAAFFR